MTKHSITLSKTLNNVYNSIPVDLEVRELIILVSKTSSTINKSISHNKTIADLLHGIYWQ